MEYGLGIPTRDPLANYANIEAVATCAEVPGFSRLAISDRSILPCVGGSRCPCTGPDAFPGSARFFTMPIPISNESHVRLPRRMRMRPRGPRRW